MKIGKDAWIVFGLAGVAIFAYEAYHLGYFSDASEEESLGAGVSAVISGSVSAAKDLISNVVSYPQTIFNSDGSGSLSSFLAASSQNMDNFTNLGEAAGMTTDP